MVEIAPLIEFSSARPGWAGACQVELVFNLVVVNAQRMLIDFGSFDLPRPMYQGNY